MRRAGGGGGWKRRGRAGPIPSTMGGLVWRAVVVVGCAGCVAACTGSASQDKRTEELESRVKVLETQVAALREDNAQMLEQLRRLEEAQEAPPPRASPVPLGARCVLLKNGNFNLTRAQVDDTLANLGGLASEVRIVPYFVNGKNEGFKLYSIRPGSLAASCGFQNGDVMQRINGLDIDTPDKALEVYAKLKTAAAFDVQLQRIGREAHVRISIR